MKGKVHQKAGQVPSHLFVQASGFDTVKNSQIRIENGPVTTLNHDSAQGAFSSGRKFLGHVGWPRVTRRAGPSSLEARGSHTQILGWEPGKVARQVHSSASTLGTDRRAAINPSWPDGVLLGKKAPGIV
jgi:hypothetical protein